MSAGIYGAPALSPCTPLYLGPPPFSNYCTRTHSPGDIFCFDTAEEQSAFFAGTLEDSGIEYTGNFTDPADVRALLVQAPHMQAKYEELGRKCLKHESGKFLKYVGSAATARDMITMVDAIVGKGALVNYVGISYGTIIGSWFVNSELAHSCWCVSH